MKFAILGAGHNGLVAAAYLGMNGHEVIVYEGNSFIGGCCSGIKLPCGCDISRGATHFGMLSRNIIQELGLSLELKRPTIQTVCISQELGIVAVPLNEDAFFKDEKEVIIGSKAMEAELSRQSKLLFSTLHDKNFPTSLTLGVKSLIDMSTFEFLSKYIKDPAVQNAYVAGSALYPHDVRDSGSAFNLLYLSLYEAGSQGGWAHVKGGMKQVSSALAEKVKEHGGKVRLSTKVSCIKQSINPIGLLVETEGSNEPEFFDGGISTIDPIQLKRICSDAFSDKDFETNEWGLMNLGIGLKMNGVLKTEPNPIDQIKPYFQKSPETAFVRQERPDTFFVKYEETSEETDTPPIWELTFPSLAFSSDACSQHVTFSLFSTPHYYSVIKGAERELRKKWVDEILDSVDQYFLGFRESIEWMEVLTPNDIETEFSASYGNLDHGNMVDGNRLFDRGHFIGKNHKTEIPRFFHGGAGSPPGGLVTGIPGYRASQLLMQSIEKTNQNAFE